MAHLLAHPAPAAWAATPQTPPWMARPLVDALLADLTRQTELTEAQAVALLSATKLQARALRLAYPPAPPSNAAPAPPPSLSDLAARYAAPDLLAQGAAYAQDHQAALAHAASAFGVAPAVLLAILGVETRFGRIQGNFPTLDTLATLGFKGPRRQDFFLGELVALVRLGQRLRRPPQSFVGSYAGALGIPQFMPSSYLTWARTADDSDRPADLFQRPDDALASVAHFLVGHGWRAGGPVALAAMGNDDDRQPYEVQGLRAQHSLGELVDAGIVDPRLAQGFDPGSPMSLVRLTEGLGSPTWWAVGTNFFAITYYNRSYRYAASVLALAAALRSPTLAGPAWAGSQAVPPPLRS